MRPSVFVRYSAFAVTVLLLTNISVPKAEAATKLALLGISLPSLPSLPSISLPSGLPVVSSVTSLISTPPTDGTISNAVQSLIQGAPLPSQTQSILEDSVNLVTSSPYFIRSTTRVLRDGREQGIENIVIPKYKNAAFSGYRIYSLPKG